MENPSFREKKEVGKLVGSNENIPAGQEWIIKESIQNKITVEAGAKLTITDKAVQNKITLRRGAELEIRCDDVQNNIKKEDEQIQDIPSSTGQETRPNQEMAETAMWLTIHRIKNGDIGGAKKDIAEGVVFNDEAKETLGWMKVRAQKEGDEKKGKFISDILEGKKLATEEKPTGSQPELVTKPNEQEKQEMLFALNINEKVLKDNIRYNAYMTSGDLKVLATDEILNIMKKDRAEALTPEEERAFTTFIKEFELLSEERKKRGNK